MGRRCLLGLAVLLVVGRPVFSQISSSLSSPQATASSSDTVVNGVLELVSNAALRACDSACKKGLATAFGLSEDFIACLCPDTPSVSSASNTRRRHLSSSDYDGGHDSDEMLDLNAYPSVFRDEQDEGQEVAGGRYLRELAVRDVAGSAAFAARIPGGLEGGAASLEEFSSSLSLVASAFGVDESEVKNLETLVKKIVVLSLKIKVGAG